MKDILSNIIAVIMQNKIINGANILNDTQSLVRKGIFPTIEPSNVLGKFSKINIKTLNTTT